MNTQEQRIAIAEACGWTKMMPQDDGWLWAVMPQPHSEDEDCGGVRVVPYYTTDLNAIHEAIISKMNTRELRTKYSDELFGVVSGATQIGNSPFWVDNATAPQRAEAFLRTLNLWKESTPTKTKP